MWHTRTLKRECPTRNQVGPSPSTEPSSQARSTGPSQSSEPSSQTHVLLFVTLKCMLYVDVYVLIY